MKKLFITIVCVIMAALSVVLGPIQAFAGSDTKIYIEDIIIITAKDEAEAKKSAGKDYTVMKTPIYDGSSDTGDNTRAKKSFLCYKTTDDPKNAITEIKALNMNAPWDYDTYNNYIKEFKANIRKDVASLCKSIEEFQWKFGSNTDDEIVYPKAQYAYEVLQYLYDDDILEHKNADLRECPRLGDLFLAFDFEDPDSRAEAENILVDILLESNAQCVNIIYNVLTLVCSENEGPDFLDSISGKNFKANIYRDAVELNAYADDIINTISETQREIKRYENEKDLLNDDIFTVTSDLSGMNTKLVNIIDYDKTHTEKYFDKYIRTVLDADPDLISVAERRLLIEKAIYEMTLYNLDDAAYMEKLKENSFNSVYGSFKDIFDLFESGTLTVKDYEAKVTKKIDDYNDGFITVSKEFEEFLDLVGNDLVCYQDHSFDLAEVQTGRNLYNILKSCKYRGYENNGEYQYTDLYKLVMKYDMTGEEAPKITYNPSDFYPIIAQLTDGQRGMLKTGILNLVLSVRVTAEQYEKSFNTLKEVIKELAEGECKIDGVDADDPYYSIFGGIDRDLFKDEDSGVAMMKSAVDLSIQERDKAFALRSEQDKEKAVMYQIMNGAGIALASVATAGAVAGITKLVLNYLAGKAANRINDGVKTVIAATSKFEDAITKGVAAATTTNSWSKFANIAGIACKVLGIVLAVAAIVFSIIVAVSAIKGIWKKPENTKYREIPKAVCNAEPITTYYMNLDGNWTKKEDVGYVYYYGVINPTLGDKEKDDSDNVIGNYKVADVANWSQSGYRQWIALYTTKSLTAGLPILASSLEISKESFVEGKRTVSMFSTGASCDMQSFLYGSPIKTFLHYVMDTDYKPYTNDTNGNASGAASAFAEPTTYAVGVLGLLLGIAGGCGITAAANKSKKKREGN